MRGYDDGINACTVAGSGNRTEVAHIGNTVEQHKERHLALFVESGYKRVDACILHCRDICNHTLMVLACNAVQFLNRNTHNRNCTSAQSREQFTRQLALQVTLYKYLINLLTGLNSLKNGAHAEYHFI